MSECPAGAFRSRHHRKCHAGALHAIAGRIRHPHLQRGRESLARRRALAVSGGLGDAGRNVAALRDRHRLAQYRDLRAAAAYRKCWP